jgi:hypothetical protein
MADFGTREWRVENERRVAYLDRLYALDGRDNPDHPMHSLLTGLLQDRAAVLLEIDRHQELRCPF